jgi:arylsulfatase A-like enzyme
MKKSLFTVVLCLMGGLIWADTRPNIVFILADDMGLGDIKAYGGDRCKIDTPHADRLAANGMKFLDAHTSSSVCTPSRYGLLTGRYSWRTHKQGGVFHGYNKALIAPGVSTVAGFLRENGYQTACIGKWHLGLNFDSTVGDDRKNIIS